MQYDQQTSLVSTPARFPILATCFWTRQTPPPLQLESPAPESPARSEMSPERLEAREVKTTETQAGVGFATIASRLEAIAIRLGCLRYFDLFGFHCLLEWTICWTPRAHVQATEGPAASVEMKSMDSQADPKLQHVYLRFSKF